jgi:uncharacterized protein YjiS (DUF1127 family)
MQSNRRSQTTPLKAASLPGAGFSELPAPLVKHGARLCETQRQADADISATLSVLACPPQWVWAAAFGQMATVSRRCWTYARARIAEWRRHARSRRELMALSDRQLRDVRITRLDAQTEANKPFWQR